MLRGYITGEKAAVRWSYHNAAAIGRYTVRRQTDGRYRLTARVVMADGFKLKQHPLTFVALHDKGNWIWPVLEFNLEGGQMQAMLGSPVGPPEW